MKKLSIEHLQVESFPTAAVQEPARGTVRAQENGTEVYNCTADASCIRTCYAYTCIYTDLCE